MTINFLGGSVAQTLTLAGGAGVTPLDVTPASLNFGSALTGTTSPSQGVLLGNGRQGAAQDYTLAVTGDFVISQNVCANPMPGFFGCFFLDFIRAEDAGAATGQSSRSAIPASPNSPLLC